MDRSVTRLLPIIAVLFIFLDLTLGLARSSSRARALRGARIHSVRP